MHAICSIGIIGEEKNLQESMSRVAFFLFYFFFLLQLFKV